MVENNVNIELSSEQIEAMPDAQKLALLIKIGFANHKAIRHQGEILEGNGKPGICEVVRSHKRQLVWMWIAFSNIAGFIGGTLVMHLNK